ncbi:MAG: adenylate/guanylate cyclase domain-containing protein [Flavobacteriaceae bacterium]
MRIHPKYRHWFSQAFTFAAIWAFFGLIYVILEKGLLGDSDYYPATDNIYDFKSSLFFTVPGSFLMGFLQGWIEVAWLKKKFINKPFWHKILFKGILYLLLIVIFLVFITFGVNAIRNNSSPFSREVIQSVRVFFTDFAFWSIVIFVAVIVDLALFFSEIKDFVGGNVYFNYAFGRYHRPKQEIRIFMFLDMKSSTTIAEKIGHSNYFFLIKSFYSEMTDAILETSGEIYQYVGDEIVVSWTREAGLKNNNCINCFEKISAAIGAKKEWYKNEYGFVPEFKAGFHIGEVTTGEIGTLKKEIIYSGDVLNTAARIQALCNQYGARVLISGILKEELQDNGNSGFSEIGEITLRGKSSTITLYKSGA